MAKILEAISKWITARAERAEADNTIMKRNVATYNAYCRMQVILFNIFNKNVTAIRELVGPEELAGSWSYDVFVFHLPWRKEPTTESRDYVIGAVKTRLRYLGYQIKKVDVSGDKLSIYF